jgi:signal transduction histidine kinase
MTGHQPKENTLSVEEVGEHIAKVHHDLKNPLSIIAGNAQFLMELDKALDLDGDVVSSVKDIREAAHELEDALDRLVTLRQSLVSS